jgi:hypothetical protein
MKGMGYIKKKIRKCKTCRKPMDCNSPNRKFCYDCGLKRRQEKSRKCMAERYKNLSTFLK